MDGQALSQTVQIVSSHGYLFVFFAMLIEGPIVTTAAAFAAALGFFDVYILLFVSILADTVADVLYFAIGHWGRLKIIEKYGPKLGFKIGRAHKIEKLLLKNAWSTITAIKITPGLATVGLITVGASRLPFKKFIKICLYITFPKCLFFIVLGYYAGLANSVAEKYLHHSQYALVIAAIAILAGNFIYTRISRAIARKIEKI